MKHPIDVLLPLLQKVRKSTVANHWMALCPAHEDSSPSLSIRQFDDNSLSVKCFAGCGTASILSAIGLEPRNLFPRQEKYIHTYRPRQPAPPWQEIIAYLREDLVAVQIGAARIAAGDTITDEDLDRLVKVAIRISEIVKRAAS